MPSLTCLNCTRPVRARRLECPHCRALRTIVETPDESDSGAAKAAPSRPDAHVTAVRASELETARVRRALTGIDAWDDVLGGGAAAPSSILLAGAPGVGKTTHALYAACEIARALRRDALILSAEMTAEMAVAAADRVDADLDRLLVRRTDDLAEALAEVERLRPACIVWDSIQAFAVDGESGTDQVTCEVVRAAIESGAKVGAVTLLISQLNAAGRPEGRRRTQHSPDVVMLLEQRRVRVSKNRFGPAPMEAKFTPLVGDEPDDEPTRH